MAAVGLLTDERVDLSLQLAGEALAPMNALYMEALSGPLKVMSSGDGEAYIMEKSGTRPTVHTIDAAADAPDLQGQTGDNDTISINTKYHGFSQKITYSEILQGNKFDTALSTAMLALAEQLWDDAAAVVNTANYANDYTTAGIAAVAEADFAGSSVQALWSILRGRGPCNVIASRIAFAGLLPTTLEGFPVNTGGNGVPNGFGIEGTSYYVDDDTFNDAETYAVVMMPEAIVGVTGLPQELPEIASAEQVSMRVVTEEQTGVSFAVSEWVDPQYRDQYVHVSAVAGFAVGDAARLARASTDAA